MYPRRRDEVAWETRGDRVVIVVPRREDALERIVARVLPLPDRVLSLEGPNAALWLAADGTHAVHDMRVPAAAEAFAREMARRGFLELLPAPRPALPPRGLPRAFRWRACRRCSVEQPLRLPPRALWLCPRCRRLNRVPAA